MRGLVCILSAWDGVGVGGVRPGCPGVAPRAGPGVAQGGWVGLFPNFLRS